MLTTCLIIMFCLQFIMSDSEYSDNGSRNNDSATTECFTDPDGVSDTSSHGTEEDFLEQFKCSICLCNEYPPYEECIELAPDKKLPIKMGTFPRNPMLCKSLRIPYFHVVS